jgi:hypothetical protein
MFKNIPDKYIRASNLIFWVTFLKLLNIIILDILPKGKTSITMGVILGVFLVFGFITRKGYKWITYVMPLVIIFPWILLRTNIIHNFQTNHLAGIIDGLQILFQLIILEVLIFDSKTDIENRGRYTDRVHS